MRVGLDFDNTIVSYDALFHKVAVEAGNVPADLPATKLAVRDYLRATGNEPVWTEMQGYVYGARLLEAAAFDGLIDCLRWARREGIDLFIVSHKTKHPFLGPPYDLHQSARDWIAAYLCDDGQPLIPAENISFELTKNDKICRIGASNFDYFVDDLPEILADSGFPAGTVPVLFDPAGDSELPVGARRVTGWSAVRHLLEGQCIPTT